MSNLFFARHAESVDIRWLHKDRKTLTRYISDAALMDEKEAELQAKKGYVIITVSDVRLHSKRVIADENKQTVFDIKSAFPTE